MKKFFLTLSFLIFSFGILSEVRAASDDWWTGENSIWNDMVESGQGPVPGGSFDLPCPQDFVQIGDNYSLRSFILNVVNFALSFLGIIAVSMVIYAGFLYVTAGGEDGQHEKAKKIIIHASVGIIVILISFALVNTLIRHAGSGGEDRDYIQGGRTFSGNAVGVPDHCREPNRTTDSFVPGSIKVKLDGGNSAPSFGGGVMVTLEQARSGSGLTFEIIGVDTNKMLLWDFGDGSQERTMSGNSVEHIFGQKRAYRVSFVGQTANADVIKATTLVIVGGVEAKFTASNDEPRVNQEIELDARGSKVPVGSVTGYGWSCVQEGGGNGCSDLLGESGEMVTLTFTESGDYTITLTVTSSTCEGSNCATGTASQEFRVGSQEPVAHFTVDQSDNPLKPNVYTFDASASRNMKGERGGVQYEWSISKKDGNNVYQPLEDIDITPTKIVTYSFEESGDYKVELTIQERYLGTDISNSSSEEGIMVNVIGVDFLVPPSVVVNESVALSAKTNQAELFAWEASQQNGQGAWENLENVFTGGDEVPVVTAIFPAPGVYKVKLTGSNIDATESNNIEKVVFVRGEGMPLAVAKVYAGENQEEEITSNLIEIDRLYETVNFDASESVGANGLIDDPGTTNVNEANLQATWSLDGIIISGDVSSVLREKLFAAGKAGQIRNVKLVVSDRGNQNVRDETSFRIRVANQDPEITSVAPIAENQDPRNYGITITAGDTDGGSIQQYKFELMENGQVKDSQILGVDGHIAYFNLAQFPGENHTFRVRGTVTDNEGGTDTMLSEPFDVTIPPDENHPPVVERIVPLNGSNQGDTNTNFRFQAIATDADQDQLSYEWSLFREGENTGLVFPDSQFLQYRFSEAGGYTVKVIASDGIDDSEETEDSQLAVTVSEVVGENQPPSISSFRVTPSQRVLGESFLLEVEATDPDQDDELTFAWTILNMQNFEETPMEGSRIVHIPADIGEYEVWVVVSDDQSEVRSATRRIYVTEE
ncbi:hypothetical protein K9L63_03225 [Candidatus Gracilibacteria bacterium]|nr:hypothetical protein [Candidatus Gracilibacteria bacterium]